MSAETTLRTPATRPLAWPATPTVYLTLDFECDYGTALPDNTYGALDGVDDLAALLAERSVPLTCFVQTELLDEHPEAMEALLDADTPVAVHPHSHSHRARSRTTTAYEVSESTDRYREFFGRDPVGYRFPNGDVRPEDYAVLADHGYEFDASVFPTWRPGHFNNSDAATHPTYLPEHDLVEVPFTVYSPRVRVPTALSYCRLLGAPYTTLLTTRPPQTVMFNVHMHDLLTPAARSSLPRRYRLVYPPNDDGLETLATVLDGLATRGYDFAVVDQVNAASREALTATTPTV